MSGAVQAGEASALAVLCRLYPSSLSQADLETISPFLVQDDEEKRDLGRERSISSFFRRDNVKKVKSFWWLLSAGLGVGVMVGALCLAGQALKRSEVELEW